MNTVSQKTIFRAVLLKEWVKLRILVWVPFLLMIAFLIDTYMRYKGIVALHGASALWLDLMYKQSIAFLKLEWVLIGGGIWFACLQFLPECSHKRLRLLFHLPVAHQLPIYSMVGVGLLVTGVLFLGAYGGFYAVLSRFYLPAELYVPMLKTLLPWGLAGTVAYCVTAAVIAQTDIVRKLALVFLGYVYISFLSETNGFDAFEDLEWYALCCVPWIFAFEAAALGVKEGRA